MLPDHVLYGRPTHASVPAFCSRRAGSRRGWTALCVAALFALSAGGEGGELPEGASTSDSHAAGYPTANTYSEHENSPLEASPPGAPPDLPAGSTMFDFVEKQNSANDPRNHIRFQTWNATVRSDGEAIEKLSHTDTLVRGGALAVDKRTFTLSGPTSWVGLITVENIAFCDYNWSHGSGQYAHIVYHGQAKLITGATTDYDIDIVHEGGRTATESTSSGWSLKGGAGVSVGGQEKGKRKGPAGQVGIEGGFESSKEKTVTSSAVPPRQDHDKSRDTKVEVSTGSQNLPVTLTVEHQSRISGTIGCNAFDDTPIRVVVRFDVINDLVAKWEITGSVGDPAVSPCEGEFPDKIVTQRSRYGELAQAHQSSTIERVYGHLRVPIGLNGESGRQAGRVAVHAGEAVEADRVYAIATQPTEVTDLPATITIPAGEFGAEVEMGCITDDEVTVTLTALDELGQPPSATLTLPSFAASSLAEIETTAVSIGVHGDSISRPSTQPCSIVVLRTPFDDHATEGTAVSVDVDDPNGILVTLPGTLTIPAGELDLEKPVEFTANTGTATVTLTAGTYERKLTFVSKNATWTTIPELRLPVGATALFEVESDLPVPTDTTVSLACSGGAGQLVIDSATHHTTVFAGFREVFARMTGGQAGETTLQVTPYGAATVNVAVNVVEADVDADEEGVVISGTSEAQGRSIEFRLPEGATFSNVLLPSGYESYVSVDAETSGYLVLSFLENGVPPSSLSVSWTLSDLPVSGPWIRVWDWVHADYAVEYELPLD